MATHPLQKWFERTGKSKSEFARDNGMSRMAIWRIINGKAEYSLDMLRRVSVATGIPLEKLIPTEREPAK